MVNRIEIVTPEEAERADFVVCVPIGEVLAFPDNLTGECSRCHCKIQFRPHAPKKPPKVCRNCVEAEINAAAARGELQAMTGPEVQEEAWEWLKAKAGYKPTA